MKPHADDQPDFIVNDTAIDAIETHQIAASGPSRLQLLGIGVVVAALGWLVITSGTGEDQTSAPTTDAPPPDTDPPDTDPPETAPEPVEPRVAGEPRVTGQLRNDQTFEVYEASPGVLCVTFPDNPPDEPSSDTCHLELESASGARVIDDVLVFGYLTADAESASIRYRSGQPSNSGIRLEANAGFFALPLRDDNAYRLQYRDRDYDIESEVPLVALRGGPSQSPADADRDNVPSAIAALSFSRRLDVVAEWTTFPEGPMVFSRQPTLLATAPGWGELLLLDLTGTRIERSTPVPSLRLSAQLSRPDAHYFLGEQVATPNQLAVDRDEVRFPVALVRIDRDTGEHLIRLFPQASTNEEPDISPIIGRPGWELGPELPTIDVTVIGGADDVVRLRTVDGESLPLDGATLLPIEQLSD